MSAKHKGKRRMRSIEIRRAENGVTVRHETEPSVPSAKQHGMAISYEPAMEHAFNSHASAKRHVNKHLAEMFGVGDPNEPDADDA